MLSATLSFAKRDRPIDHEPDWVQLGKTEDGFAINQYFVDHPEMVLGELTTESTQYGREELTVAPIEGAVLADQLAEAVQHIEGNYTAVEIAAPDVADVEAQRKTLPADPKQTKQPSTCDLQIEGCLLLTTHFNNDFSFQQSFR